MKYSSFTLIADVMKLLVRLLCSKTLLFVAGYPALMLTLCGNVLAAYAGPLNQQLSLLQYKDNTVQPLWQEDGVFADVLNQDEKHYRINYLAKQTDFVLNDALTDLKKKITITFSPRVVLKPFIIVEELQDYLVAYQSKKQRDNIHIDENFQAKVLLQPLKLLRLKKISTPRLFSVSPYYNKVYGLHLHISW